MAAARIPLGDTVVATSYCTDRPWLYWTRHRDPLVDVKSHSRRGMPDCRTRSPWQQQRVLRWKCGEHARSDRRLPQGVNRALRRSGEWLIRRAVLAATWTLILFPGCMPDKISVSTRFLKAVCTQNARPQGPARRLLRTDRKGRGKIRSHDIASLAISGRSHRGVNSRCWLMIVCSNALGTG